MENSRRLGSLPLGSAGWLPCAAWRFFAACAILFPGCATGSFLQSSADVVREPTANAADETKPAEAKPVSPPAPKTLPQAICAYWRCLQLPRYEIDKNS